jgi:hypothetical protein
MKLKLKEKELPAVQLLLALPAAAKQMLDRYVAFVAKTSGRDVEGREIVVEMLEQFMASDRDFRQWQKLAQKSVFESHENRIEKSPPMNGHGGE